MPIYEYACSACRHRAEILHGIHESGPNFCPACGAEGTMRKGVVAPAVVFKGSGWAKKDRRSTGAPARDRTDDDSAPKPAEGGPEKVASDKAGSAKADSGESGSGARTTGSPDAKPAPKGTEGG